MEKYGDQLSAGKTSMTLHEERLDVLKETVDGMNTDLNDKLDKVVLAIVGNGKPGLKTRVAIHQYVIGVLTPFVLALGVKVVWDWMSK